MNLKLTTKKISNLLDVATGRYFLLIALPLAFFISLINGDFSTSISNGLTNTAAVVILILIALFLIIFLLIAILYFINIAIGLFSKN